MGRRRTSLDDWVCLEPDRTRGRPPRLELARSCGRDARHGGTPDHPRHARRNAAEMAGRDDAVIGGCAAVVVQCLLIVEDALMTRLDHYHGAALLGPRTGSKTHVFATPPNLPTGPFQRLIDPEIVRVESLRPSSAEWR